MSMSAAAYLITFTTYGTWLHGTERGSINRRHNRYGEPWLVPNPTLESARHSLMCRDAYVLDEPRRDIVLTAMCEHALHQSWTMLAAHVRTNHVHTVIAGNAAPERMMNALKAYATRALNASRLDARSAKRWTRHGSTRYLWADDAVAHAVQYVIHQQGQPMAVYKDPRFA